MARPGSATAAARILVVGSPSKFSMVRGHRALGGVIRCGRGGGRGCDGGGVADKDDSISTMSSS